AATLLRVENDGRSLVYILVRIENELVTVEGDRRDAHTDRAVAGRRRVNRHAGGVRRREQRFLPDAKRFLALADVLAGELVKFRARHRPLEFLAGDDLPEEGVGRQQNVVVEEDVIDANHAFLT